MPRILVSEGMDLSLEGFDEARFKSDTWKYGPLTSPLRAIFGDGDRGPLLKSNIWTCPPPPTQEEWARIIDECDWWPEEHKDLLYRNLCPDVPR